MQELSCTRTSTNARTHVLVLSRCRISNKNVPTLTSCKWDILKVTMNPWLYITLSLVVPLIWGASYFWTSHARLNKSPRSERIAGRPKALGLIATHSRQNVQLLASQWPRDYHEWRVEIGRFPGTHQRLDSRERTGRLWKFAAAFRGVQRDENVQSFWAELSTRLEK